MLHIFFHSLCRQIRQNKGVSIILFTGVIVSIYCVSVMQGLAIGQYRLATKRSTYATITVEPGTDITNELQDFSKNIFSFSNNKIANILYMTALSEDSILIGWQGVNAQKWFPITSGRFFNEIEQEKGEYCAFISDSLSEKILEKKSISIGSSIYEIIGTGWIVPYNITTAMSARVNYDFFQLDEGEKYFFSIIPFLRFQEEFAPSLILIHFNGATYDELEENCAKLLERYPNSQFYVPDRNSNSVLSENQIKYGILSLMLVFLAATTVLQLMREWIAVYRKELYIYYLCGMEAYRCTFLIYGQWLLLYCLGSFFAMLLHYCSFPILEKVLANYPPAPFTLCIILAGLFLLSVVYSYSNISSIFSYDAWEEYQ